MIAMLLKVEPESRVNISINRGVQKTAIRTHAGADIAFERSPLSITMEFSRVQNDDVLILYDMSGVTVYEEDVLAPVRRVIHKLELAKNLTTIRAGNMPVLFSPGGSLALFIPFSEGLDGKNVFKGVSPVANKIGEKVFDQKLTLLDDGTLDGKFGSAPYDDEGIPHRRNVLVDQGVLKGSKNRRPIWRGINRQRLARPLQPARHCPHQLYHRSRPNTLARHPCRD
jgi:PmbA protein